MPDEDALGDVPPEEFVAARDELAKRLKADGESARAAEVKKLRKPTVTQWLVQQVRLHRAADVNALREASRDVAKAQEAAITGGDRDALRVATATRQTAVQGVERAVDEVLARSGRPAQYRDEVVGIVESGVTAEVASGTFGVRDDLELPEPVRREPAPDPAAERRVADAKVAIEIAEERVRRAREELEKAEAALAAVRERHRL